MKNIDEIINWNSPKFLTENRTFKTRLLFLNKIFSDVFPDDAILGRCIQYKLNFSLESYIEDLNRGIWNLSGVDPLKVLKELDKL